VARLRCDVIDLSADPPSNETIDVFYIKTSVFHTFHFVICVIKNKLLITFTPKILSCLSGTIGDNKLERTKIR